MSQKPDCDVFQEQLDALLEKGIPEAGLEQLRLHAVSCPGCAMQLRVHEHLVRPSLSELERMVPDELAGSVLPRVQAQIAEHVTGRHNRPVKWQGWSRFVPALAAATLLLCVGSGFLYWEVRQLRSQESLLLQQVTEQGRQLAQLDSRTSMDPVARAASLAGRSRWERVLARRNSVSLSELEQMLHTAPSSTTVFSAAESEALAESLPTWIARLVGSALSDIQSDDGIQAGELLQLISVLDIDTDRRVSTSRLLAISRQTARLGRS